jgi:hypothetical protein
MIVRSTLALALLAAGPAFAAQPIPLPANQSMYTDLKLADCSITKSDDFSTIWACPGYKGIPVMVAEDDDRFQVSYGLKSTEEVAAKQTLPPFNTLGDTIEWRMSNRTGGWKPFATILRFKTGGDDGPKNEVLVVTKLAEGATCHIAYVDATANPNANALAQQAADQHGMDFNCKKDKPLKLGAFKAW